MKISKLFILKWSILLTLVSVLCEEELKCKEPRQVGCPEIICGLINSRVQDADFCKEITCEGIVQEDCPIGTEFENGLTMCGCCPGCAKFLEENDPCGIGESPPFLDPDCKEGICPIHKNECKPGLVCNYLGEPTRVCLKDTSSPDEPAEGGNQRTCEYLRNLPYWDPPRIHWSPVCDLDGSFAAKQCKDDFCFCVDRAGNRIFGREWLDKAENQTCGCSRHVEDLRTQGNIATVHCSPDGNYEPLQCDMDSGLCYCVETQTGELTGAVLPEHQWKLLPCYSLNLTDMDPTGQYLRKCESQWGAGQRIMKEAFLHGLDVYAIADFKCDYDGSFGPVRRDRESTYCVPKNGNLEESRGHFQETDKRPVMECTCFRDSLIYEEEARPFLKECDLATGNYKAISIYDQLSKDYSCVDKDGMYFGDIAPKEYQCCLLGDGCLGETPIIRKCMNPKTNYEKIIRNCTEASAFWR